MCPTMMLKPLAPFLSFSFVSAAAAMSSPSQPWIGLPVVGPVELISVPIVVVLGCVTSLEYAVVSVLQPLVLPARVLS